MTDTHPDPRFPHLEQKLLLRVDIELLTGLHIGGNDTGLAIGGADRLVVRDPATGQPYLPGSSLKGKLRSLVERAGLGSPRLEVDWERGRPCECCQCGTCDVCAVFGVAAAQGRDARARLEGAEVATGAARLMVRDGRLTNAEDIAQWPYLDLPYTEIKTEVSIDRLTSAANPRQFERVPAGARFASTLVMNLFAGDPGERFVRLPLDGLALLAADSLGGQGSRGYGAVRIEVAPLGRLRISEGRLVRDDVEEIAGVRLRRTFELAGAAAAEVA